MKKKDVFGKWAWPKKRVKDLPKTAQAEPNTPEEDAALSALYKYVVSNVEIPPEAAENIQAALKSRNYDDVLSAPYRSTVHRGMVVGESWLKSALKMSDDEDLPARGSREAGFTFTPRRAGGASSWTYDADVAGEFSALRLKSEPSGTEARYVVTMTAPADKSSKTMMTGPDGFYGVLGLGHNDDEEEVIAFGPVKVTQIKWERVK
jgi:hypothetical protein